MKKVSLIVVAFKNPSKRRAEMKLSKVCKKTSKMALALAAIIALVAIFPCAAVAAGPDECNLIGTWAGNAGDDMYWMAVHTAGSTKNSGTMLMDWIYIDKGLLNAVEGFDSLEGSYTHLTPGHGVWEKVAEGIYNYTWYAYGIYEADFDDDGIIDKMPGYVVRVTGTATSDGCDTINIDYSYEIRKPEGWPPQGMDENWDLLYSTTGQASEFRVKVVEPEFE
jgi:hypothetical protein